MKIEEVKDLDNIKLSVFAPIEKEYPIVEVLYKEKILLDLSVDDQNPQIIKIFFHEGSSGIQFNNEVFLEVLAKAKEKLLKSMD